VAVVSTAKYFVPRLLGTFCRQYPDIDIALEVLNRDGVVQRLRANLDDIYIMSIPPQDIDIERQDFLANPLVVVAPGGHPLAGAKKAPLARLAAERFMLRERGAGTRLACDAHFRQQRFKPQLRLELGSNEAIKQAVAGGMGIAVLSRHALGEHLAEDSLAILDIEDFPIHASWYIVQRRGKRLSPIAGVFQAHLVAQARELKLAGAQQFPPPERAVKRKPKPIHQGSRGLA
jgi:LysR family transcriptional regulator, low CO2-responsive transcriptional regulator